MGTNAKCQLKPEKDNKSPSLCKGNAMDVGQELDGKKGGRRHT